MSRNGAGVYSLPPSYLAETGDTILADQHNSPLEDLQTDANTPRPIVAGGTGASSAVSARTNLSVMSVADIQSGYVPKVATKAALSALDTASFKAAVLTETTREKLWMWKSGDFSAEEAADTDNVNYIPADGVSTSLGCWVAATGDGVTVRTIAAGGTGADNAADARTNLGLEIGTDVQAHSAVLDATTASFTTAQETKLSGIATSADVTSATNVNAAGAVMNTDTATTDMQFVGTGSDLSIDPAKLLKRGDAADAIDAVETLLSSSANIEFLQSLTNNVATTVQAKLRGWFSFTADYGAVGDGSTDNLTAWQNAMTDLKANGGTLFIESGTYAFSDQISFWPNVNIIGQGSWNTIFRCAPPTTLDSAFAVMGDAPWRAAGGAPNTKNWQLHGIRFDTGGTFAGTHTGSSAASVLTDSTESWTADALVGRTITNTTDGSSGTITANTATTVTATLSGGTDNDWDTGDSYTISTGALSHGVVLVGIAGAYISDVQVKGFTAAAAYGFALIGNPNVVLNEGSVNCEGHYNTIVGCYFFGNYHGVYLGGVAGAGQANNNVFVGGASRLNTSRDVTFGPTNSNVLLGFSFEAASSTDYGAYFQAGAAGNLIIKGRFEGAYGFHPFFFVDDSTCKRNIIEHPTYGAVYNTCDPTNAAFAVDPGGRNQIVQMDLNGKTVYYAPLLQFVRPGSTTAMQADPAIYGVANAHSATGANAGTSFVNGRTDTSTAAATAAAHARFYNPNGLVGSITTNASATTYSTTSDERLKTDFRDFDAGPAMDALKVYDFAWKAGGRSHGVKAQEAHEVFPEAIVAGQGEPGDEEFAPWQADYSKFVPLLLKEVQSLRARVAELEAKQ